MIDRSRRAVVSFPIEELVELLELPAGLTVLGLEIDHRRDTLAVVVQHENLDRVPVFDEAPRLLDHELERIVNPPPPRFIGPPTKAQARFRAMIAGGGVRVARTLAEQRFIADHLLAPSPAPAGGTVTYTTED